MLNYLYTGYNNTELEAAVDATGTIPPLQINQLLQVVYKCTDTAGDITANSLCIAGCVSQPGITNDQCAL